jgi:hypothetical protein
MGKSSFEKIEFVITELRKISQELKKTGGDIYSIERIDPDGRYGLTANITIGFLNYQTYQEEQ